MGVVYLVRHGQASFGALNYDELSTLGHRQAGVVGEALRPRLGTIDHVVAGTLRRQRDTAAGCLKALGSELDLGESAAWNEFDHEELLLKHEPEFADPPRLYARLAASADPRAAFEDLFRGSILRWIGGQHDADYRETWTGFRTRCTTALTELVAALGPSKTALVFTSGGPIATICAGLLGLAHEQAIQLPANIANCSVTKIVYGKRGLILSTFNEHGWFEGEGRSLLSYR